jgi:HEAT repeat protein
MSAQRRGRSKLSELASAAAEADQLAASGSERELAALRARWDDELEAAARSGDFRERAVAYRAIGQFRYRQKLELLRRGLEDESPAARGSALLSLELLSRDGPAPVNADRPLLHTLAAHDSNAAVRRLAILCLKNGSPSRDTIVMLEGLANDDEQDRELREAAKRVAAHLTKKGRAR